MAQGERSNPNVLSQGGSQATLKVFLGFAPGIGKTYAMLASARRLRERGVEVVVCYAETHGRPEIARLLEGLEALPRRMVSQRGAALSEFDLDRALARRPKVLLLDELAHTNPLRGAGMPNAGRMPSSFSTPGSTYTLR